MPRIERSAVHWVIDRVYLARLQPFVPRGADQRSSGRGYLGWERGFVVVGETGRVRRYIPTLHTDHWDPKLAGPPLSRVA